MPDPKITAADVIQMENNLNTFKADFDATRRIINENLLKANQDRDYVKFIQSYTSNMPLSTLDQPYIERHVKLFNAKAQDTIINNIVPDFYQNLLSLKNTLSKATHTTMQIQYSNILTAFETMKTHYKSAGMLPLIAITAIAGLWQPRKTS